MAEFTRKRAILIGVDKYTDVTPLNFCGADARDTADIFRKSLQFGSADVLEFTVTSALKPERNQIFHHIVEFLKGGIGEDELLIFYFSGHGMIDSRDNKDYLLPIDASRNSLRLTGIKVEDIVDILTGTKCKNIVMFIDACREAIGGAKGLNCIGDDSKNAAKRAGIVSFFSCDPKEKSYEIQALGHGTFTHCILDAIAKGECNTVAEIDEFLRGQVPLINSRNGKPPQLPYAVIEPAEKGKLAIFYSEIRQSHVEDRYGQLTNKLGDLFAEGGFDPLCFDRAIILIERAKSNELTAEETKKMNFIELLCKGILKPLSFQAAWMAMERNRPTMPAAPLQLDRLK